MQLKPITAIVVLFLMVASLSVAGCINFSSTPSPTPTPTPTPTSTPTPTDYSSALTNATESGNFIMERPFTKSTNERGNDVYKGVGRNATNPGSHSVTLVEEVTKSQTEAKQVYDKATSDKLNQGYTADTTAAAEYKSTACPGFMSCVEVWAGSYGTKYFLCSYGYDSTVHGWKVTQQSFAM
ncbi:MAG: hypothetical protein ABSC87_06685 [Halobacteriota archaeon]